MQIGQLSLAIMTIFVTNQKILWEFMIFDQINLGVLRLAMWPSSLGANLSIKQLPAYCYQCS